MTPHGSCTRSRIGSCDVLCLDSYVENLHILMMLYVVAAIGAIAVGWWLLLRWLRQRLIRQIENAVNMVKLAMCARLLQKLKATYDDDVAAWMAAALTNEAFSETSANDLGRDFLAQNRQCV